MQITLQFAEKGGTKELTHDLHFQAPKYEITHVLVLSRLMATHVVQDFPKPSPGLLKLLNESKETSVPTPVSAPAPSQPSPATVSDDTKKRKLETSEDNRPVKKTTAGKGREWTGKPSDMDRLAQGLQKLHEDDLLQVVRIVSDHRTPEMYVKNDLEGISPFLGLFSLVQKVNLAWICTLLGIHFCGDCGTLLDRELRFETSLPGKLCMFI